MYARKRNTENADFTTDFQELLLVDTKTLQKITSCGRDAALKLGYAAGARVQIGKRVLWNVEKIKKYLDQISE